MSTRTPTIPSTGDNPLDGELLDIRKRLARLESLLDATTPGSRPPPQVSPPVIPPQDGSLLYIGEPISAGTAGRVLYEGAGPLLADSASLLFDDTNKSLTVQAANSATKKALIGTETTSDQTTALATIASERISSGAISANFGAGYVILLGQSGGASVQVGALIAQYDGNGTDDIKIRMIGRAAAAIVDYFSVNHLGQLALQIAGGGFSIKEGSNCKMGQATLVAGTKTVANTSVTANSRIVLTPNGNTNEGWLSVGTIVAGTSFVIQSSNAADTRTINYLIFEPS